MLTEQTKEIAIKKDEQRESDRKRLQERKKSPEYRLNKIKSVLQKPWIASVEDSPSKDDKNKNNIVVTLEDGYEFISNEGLKHKAFHNIEDIHLETTKSKVRKI